MTPKPPMWTIEEGLAEIQMLQREARAVGFHLCLAGGVINTMRSNHDLDIVAIPLVGFPPNPEEMLQIFRERYGADEAIEPSSGDVAPGGNGQYWTPPYYHKVKFENGGKRVDCFLVKSFLRPFPRPDGRSTRITITQEVGPFQPDLTER